ncbi:hypothetical protein [Carboxylicivirga linearis]|uniref:Lipoprotein n=1 Tax=Carboxylicivirga linearis TaxID=1628157 RepID=A0ABS5JXZ8_9BACT|nr:hypothetical protein [Carboxylicivirga linearis]MBS2099750.1 hypothetical protein [Carboxylicivirga linearis]
MKKLLFSLSLALLALSSCNDDDPTNNTGVIDGNLIKGDVVEDLELDPTVDWVLDGTLSVKKGAKLTIPAGTTIKAKSGFYSYIMVEQGGQIFINGTAEDPVTLTSNASTPKAADWGGLHINGYAPISGATEGTTNKAEVDASLEYGGTDANDNSGSITYLKLMYTGARSSADVEHNGLTLNGVGNGTTIENIYIPYGADDAIEWFGGTVNVKNLLVVNQDDDMFDVTEGWSGTLENAFGIWTEGFSSTEADPRGIEADGNMDGNGPDHVGQSDFTMKNITIVNNSGTPKFSESEDGNKGLRELVKIRRGATATLENILLKNGDCDVLIDFQDSKHDGETSSVITYTVENVSWDEDKYGETGVRMPEAGDATVNKVEGNTGCPNPEELFGWTGFTEWN